MIQGSEAEELEGGRAEGSARRGKRARLVWTAELHARFMNAVNHLVNLGTCGVHHIQHAGQADEAQLDWVYAALDTNCSNAASRLACSTVPSPAALEQRGYISFAWLVMEGRYRFADEPDCLPEGISCECRA